MRSARAVAGAAVASLLAIGTVGTVVVGLPGDDGRPEIERAPASAGSLAAQEAAAFLDQYVDPDGRVVRRDQGGDTVSEGQAYALLLAVGVGNGDAFERIWTWTRTHLGRPDGLLAWRWADGAVVDESPAADADLDTAWALALAEERWPGRGYGAAATSLATAVDAYETATVAGSQRVLAAGPWATGAPVVVNPSYASPVGDAVLAAAGYGDRGATSARQAGNREVVVALLEQDGVPADWAQVTADGAVQSVAAPGEQGPGTFGWDAVRVPLRYGASCDPADRAVAAELWDDLLAGAGVERMGDHPARLVGAASAAAAAGDDGRARQLLDESTEAADARPSYYGDALVALGRLLLDTDHLGSCPPLR